MARQEWEKIRDHAYKQKQKALKDIALGRKLPGDVSLNDPNSFLNQSSPNVVEPSFNNFNAIKLDDGMNFSF